MYELAKKKPWLREQCGFVLYRSLESPAKLDRSYAQSVIDKLQSTGLAKTPEGVAIWIVILRNFPTVNLPSGVWHSNSPLSQEEKPKLALVMKEASVSDLGNDNSDASVSQRGSWSTNVHFAWHVVMDELMSPFDRKTTAGPSKRLSFSEFWNDCVESKATKRISVIRCNADLPIDGLFKSTSSDERKYWGLVLFHRGLSVAATSDIISCLFSAKLIQCLTNHLSFADRYLHRAAEKARRTVVEQARTSPDIRIMIIKALLINGYVDFDKVSKTRTMEDLLSGLNETTTSQLCEIYNAFVLQPRLNDEKHASSRRQIAADQLVSALKSIWRGSEKANSDGNITERSIRDVLSLLARFAYFDFGVSAQPEISVATRDIFKARISSCLAYLAVNSQNPFVFASQVTRVISERENIPDNARLVLKAENDVQEVLVQTIKTIRRLDREIIDGETFNRSFHKSALLLLSVVFLQVHDGDLDAIGMLEELNETFSKKRLKHYTKRDNTSSDALVEILLALISKPSKLFRRLSQQVFEGIALDIDESALQSMLRVLNAKEDSEGRDELFDQSNGDEEEDDEVSNSDASNVEIFDVKMLSRDKQTSDAPDDSASVSTNEDNGDGPDEELADFNAKLAQALGTRPANEDLNAQDGDTSNEDMDDEEMEALDEHLANVFREQKKVASKKTEKKDARKTIVDFKCRVLELLDIFVKKQHRKPLALLLIPSLLALLRTTSNSQVSQKASDSLREYSRVCKGKELQQVESADSLFRMLESVHEEALIMGSNAHAGACSQASLLLVRILAGLDREHLRQVVRIYARTYAASQEKALFEKNFKVKMSLFTDFSNWAVSVGK